MDALVAEVEHAVACLSDLGFSRALVAYCGSRARLTSWIAEGSAEGLNCGGFASDWRRRGTGRGIVVLTSKRTTWMIVMIAVGCMEFGGSRWEGLR